MTKYADMGTAIGKLTQEKNEAYGDSFAQAGKLLELLFPNGIQPNQYRDALGIVRVVDKLFRIATRKEAFGESPWKDIAGYGLLGAVADEKGVCDVLTEETERLGGYDKELRGLDGMRGWAEPDLRENDEVITQYMGRPRRGRIAHIDNAPDNEGLPYHVQFSDGDFVWRSVNELERA